MAKFRADNKYQGLCLQSYAGSKTIDAYDMFSPELRKIVRESDLNLCPVCLADVAWNYSNPRTGNRDLNSYKSAIIEMERRIKCEEAQ